MPRSACAATIALRAVRCATAPRRTDVPDMRSEKLISPWLVFNYPTCTDAYKVAAVNVTRP
jgi:hypothetical protein